MRIAIHGILEVNRAWRGQVQPLKGDRAPAQRMNAMTLFTIYLVY